MSDARSRARPAALATVVLSTVLIAIGYASAFAPNGPPVWGAWMLAIGVPLSVGGIVALGATRTDRGLGPLKAPILFVILILVAGFGLALALPPSEARDAATLFGLPLRAAIVVYGVGLLPIAVLPIAYALTFHTQTLTEEDIQKVRELALQKQGGTIG